MLDATDQRILTALQRRGRMSNSDLSDAVHLSPSACHRRVQRLEEAGFIRDYVALLDARKMGVPTTVFVEITLQGQADEVLEAFEKAVARIPNVLECHLMAGTADYILKVAPRGPKILPASIANTLRACRVLDRCNQVLRLGLSLKRLHCQSEAVVSAVFPWCRCADSAVQDRLTPHERQPGLVYKTTDPRTCRSGAFCDEHRPSTCSFVSHVRLSAM